MSASDTWRRRQRAAVRVGGWAFVVVAVAHLVLANLVPSTGDALVVERQMQQARVPIPPAHSYADLLQGFSWTMSVLLIAWGAPVLLMTRRDRVPEGARFPVGDCDEEWAHGQWDLHVTLADVEGPVSPQVARSLMRRP